MFASESALQELVDRWTDCSLPSKDWTHAAHIAVCSALAWENTLAQTYWLMKTGLHRFNEATGTPNTDDRGYHETLTRFWTTMLFYKIHRGHFNSRLRAANAMIELYGSDSRADRPYYSFDLLKKRESRRVWIAPDLSGPIAMEAFRW